MKNLRHILLLLAIPALSLCTGGKTPAPQGNCRIAAEFTVPQGSTALPGWFSWDAQSEIGLFSSENENIKFALSEGAGHQSALFAGNTVESLTTHESVSAYYPFQGSLAGSLLEVNPAEWPKGLFLAGTEVDDPANIQLSFQPALPVVVFRIKNESDEAVTIESVSLECERNAFYEKGRVDMLAAQPEVKAYGTLKQQVTVTPAQALTLASGASANLPMCLIPANPGQFSVVVHKKDGSTVSFDKSQTGGFKAGSIYPIDLVLETKLPEMDLSVLSFNIRFFDDNRPDYDYDTGGQPWYVRRPAVKAFFEQNDIDVVGLQEVRRTQLANLQEDFGEEWFIYCPGRISGGTMTKTSDESVGVMYRKARFNCLDYGCFWLSETPNEIASTRLGQDSPMIISWLHLEEKTCPGKDLWFFSCHVSWAKAENPVLPDQEVETLLSQIEYLTDISRDDFKRSSTPIFAVGDFNNEPENRPMKTLRGFFNDARLTCPETASTYRNTYNAYGNDGAKILDFAFYGKGTPLEYIVDNSSNYAPGVLFISDHYPVLFKLNY